MKSSPSTMDFSSTKKRRDRRCRCGLMAHTTTTSSWLPVSGTFRRCRNSRPLWNRSRLGLRAELADSADALALPFIQAGEFEHVAEAGAILHDRPGLDGFGRIRK